MSASLVTSPRKGSRFAAKARHTLRKPQFWFGFAFLVPLWIAYTYLGFWPIAQAFFMALTKYRFMEPAKSTFAGLLNFQRVLDYNVFWIALRNNLVYAISTILILIPLALILATALNALRKGQNAYRFVIFLPVIVSFVAIALLFRMLMDPQVGMFNQVLHALGLPTSMFLTRSKSALGSIIGIDIWKGVGFHVILLSAGMLNIPREMYDAAEVDGANAWQKYWNVTIPLLQSTLELVIIMIVMGALQAFGTAFLLTSGGPNNATMTVNLIIYNSAFLDLDMGFATATAFMLFILILAVTLVQLKLLKPKWSY